MIVSIEKPGTPTELVHAGIKGMKWGIRKERTSTEQLRRQAKTDLFTKGKPVGETRIKEMLNTKPLTMSDYNKMSTRKTSIPAGTTLYRLTRDPKDTSLPGFTYVTTNKRDAEIYRGILPAQRLFDPLRKSDYKQHYEIALKTKKTLRGPSEKERVDVLADLMDEKILPSFVGRKLSVRDYYSRVGVISGKEAKNDTGLELALKLHRRVHQTMGNKKDHVSIAYTNAMIKKGYDMLSDDNDSGIVAKSPKIILDPKSSTSLHKIKPLSNDDILNAQINLRFPKQK